MKETINDFEVFKLEKELFVRKEELDKVEKKFDFYALKYDLEEIKLNLEGLLTEDDLDPLKFGLDKLEKETGQFVRKEEILTRMNMLNSELNVKL